MAKWLIIVTTICLSSNLSAQFILQADRPMVNVRGDATIQSARIGELKFGQKVERVASKDEWYQINLPDGRLGWVHSDLMQELGETPIIEKSQPPAITDAGSSQNSVEKLVQNPYAEGLQRLKEGDYLKALVYFERVIEDKPKHVRSLLHAARSHRELGQYEEARDKLYRAVEMGSGARELANLYSVVGRPDSAKKYEAIAQGENWEISAPSKVSVESSVGQESSILWTGHYVYVGILFCILVSLVIAAFIIIRRRGPRRRQVYSKFSSAMKHASSSTDQAEEGEVRELDRQIFEKREALRVHLNSISEISTSEECDESQIMEEILKRLESVRNALQAQDERALIYAELARLQQVKIQSMEREIELMRLGTRD